MVTIYNYLSWMFSGKLEFVGESFDLEKVIGLKPVNPRLVLDVESCIILIIQAFRGIMVESSK